MKRSGVARPIRFMALIVLAITVGGCVTLAIAGLEHGIAALDGTLKWFALMAGAYLAGAIAVILVLTLGWAVSVHLESGPATERRGPHALARRPRSRPTAPA